MLVILPFEKMFYEKYGMDVTYVGHPLVEVINEFRQTYKTKNNGNAIKIIALLPGSRKQEILKKLPVMLEVTIHYPQYKFVVAMAPGLPASFYAELLAPYKNVDSVVNKTYALLAEASAAVVTSGTATLETALFGVPEIICYKGSPISYQIAKRLIKIKYICLVNLVMDREVVKELIQDDFTVAKLKTELDRILLDEGKQQQLREDYEELSELLSKGGHASANAAANIYQYLTGARK
jgi:lipid-A-disaccharide synthase